MEAVEGVHRFRAEDAEGLSARLAVLTSPMI